MGMQLATVNSELQTALASLTKEQDASSKAKYIANAAEVCSCIWLTKYIASHLCMLRHSLVHAGGIVL
jgi:hypothetical protein